MKNLIFTFILLVALYSLNYAQYTTVQNGKWWYPSTWSTDPNASAIPDSTDNVIIKHDINIDCGGKCKNLTVNANGKLHNGTVKVYGSLTNNGIITGRGEWNGMKIFLNGNLTNSGYYNADTEFNGIADQTVVSTDTLSLGRCYDNNASSKIIFENKIILTETWLLLKNSTLEFNDSLKIKNTILDGGIINGHNNVLFAIGHKNSIGWVGAVTFHPCYTELKNLKLGGANYLFGNGNIGGEYALGIKENVENIGIILNTFQTSPVPVVIHILNDFVNNGTINEIQTGINFEIHNSSFSNKGNLTASSVKFTGTCSFFSADSVAIGAFGASNSSTSVTIISKNLIFKDRSVIADFNGGMLNLPQNGLFKTTFQWNNELKNVTLNANNSEVKFVHVGENVCIKNAKIGDVEIKGGNSCTISGETEVLSKASLRNFGSYYPHVTIDGNFKNYGTITNNSTSGTLELIFTGNILHDGSEWSNSKTKIAGVDNQFITIPNNALWTGKVVLDAVIEGSSFQWQKDGTNLKGAKAKEFSLYSGIKTTNYGVYQCVVDGKTSRQIIIGKAFPSEEKFTITDVQIKNISSTSTLLTWKTSVQAWGFIFYAENNTDNGYPLEAMEPENRYATEHSLLLKNLNPGLTYYFIIDQNDQNRNIVRSEEFSFVAGDTLQDGCDLFLERIKSMKKLPITPDEEGSVYYDASFVSKDIVYVVTNHNRLFKTVNGGKSWVNISPDPNKDYNKKGAMPKVHFFNKNIGAVAFSVDDGANGYDYSKVFGYVWCTTDGGATWSEKFDVNQDQILHLKQVSENLLYVSGPAKYGVAGYKWFKKVVRDEKGNYTLSDVASMPDSRPHVMSADWLNENVGVAIGKYNRSPYPNQIFKTCNGAVTWSSIQANLPQADNPTHSYSDQSVQMIDSSNIGFAYANKEGDEYITKFYRSNDGGGSWSKGTFDVTPPSYPNFYFEENGERGILSGASTDSSRIFYFTENGGANWKHHVLQGITGGQIFFASEISSDGTIWIAGNNNGIWKSCAKDSTVEVESSKNIPGNFVLMQNYPNPFNPTTVIEFSLSKSLNVSLIVYNSIGQKVAELAKGSYSAGKHSVNFNATNLSSGIYFYRIIAGNFVRTNKMILLK
jgi:photosystem II stability/assembly factor-like uncharacterized protein